MSRTLLSTYRIQLTRDFPLSAARALVPYLHELGVTHLYCSPVLAARPGSTHGYDVVDHTRVNPELGTEDDFRGLAADLHARGMGIVLDIVPNHMAAHAANPYWDNVLERGRHSRYAHWFDIDWDAPGADDRVVLPILGDEPDAVLARGEITVDVSASAVRLKYFDHSLPLDPATLPRELQLATFDPAGAPAVQDWQSGDAGRERLRALLDAQHYRLAFWRDAPETINYRRFFDVNDLVALRMETQEVFDELHALILTWVRDGVLDGLRVDHVDGLRAPTWYLGRLRAAVDERRHADAPERFPIVVEKILIGDEQLPPDWPVDGTTGYDFMNEVGEIMLEPNGYRAIEASYRAIRRNPALEFIQVAREGKRRALAGALRPDVRRVARAAAVWAPDADVDAMTAAIAEFIVHLDVYRTYVVEPGVVRDADRARIHDALSGARQDGRADRAALALIERALLSPPEPGNVARDAFVARLQQASGPAAAKGVEDTALYVWLPLVSRNEVGASPERPLEGADARLHARNAMRARDWPAGLLATNTHDTKRSADVRARLDMLATMPDEWARHVSRWRKLNRRFKQVVRGKPAPGTNGEYLYYQTIVGIWPAPHPDRRADDLPDVAWRQHARERMRPYALKAAREAKLRTSWTESDTEYEEALDEFVRVTLHASSDELFLADVARLTSRIADGAAMLALARVAIHLLAPGTPDVYQGDELWNFTLVDPDNRRPVDFARRSELLRSADHARVLADGFEGRRQITDDEVKLALTHRLLRFRRDHPELARGEYVPLDGGTGAFAFLRTAGTGASVVVARTRPEGAIPIHIAVPAQFAGAYRSILTGRAVELGSSTSVASGESGSLSSSSSPIASGRSDALSSPGSGERMSGVEPATSRDVGSGAADSGLIGRDQPCDVFERIDG